MEEKLYLNQSGDVIKFDNHESFSIKETLNIKLRKLKVCFLNNFAATASLIHKIQLK